MTEKTETQNNGADTSDGLSEKAVKVMMWMAEHPIHADMLFTYINAFESARNVAIGKSGDVCVLIPAFEVDVRDENTDDKIHIGTAVIVATGSEVINAESFDRKANTLVSRDGKVKAAFTVEPDTENLKEN